MHTQLEKGKAAFMLLILGGVMALALGCAVPLCNKHLYIFREAPEKSAPEVTALMLTDPNLAAALVPEAAGQVSKGLPWAPEQPAFPTDAYRLSLTRVDGRSVYQGLCLDTMVTDVCEIRAGSRRLAVTAELFGPWGRRSQHEEQLVNLEPGKIYFLRIEGGGGPEGQVRVIAAPLARPYTPEFRQRLLDYQRRHTTRRSMD